MRDDAQLEGEVVNHHASSEETSPAPDTTMAMVI